MGKAIINNTAIHCKGTSRRSNSPKETSPGTTVKSENTNDYEIRSVAKAIDLFEAICDGADNNFSGDKELSITKLSTQLGIQKSTVFRMLATFENRGYIEHDEKSGSYQLGMNAYELGRKLLLCMPLLREARPVLEDLCRRCNEAIYLVVKNGSDFLMIDLVESTQQVKVASLLGKRFPLTSSAPGKLMLAFSTQRNSDSSTTEYTQSFIRKNGYCADQGGLGEAVSSLAAPLFNAGGKIVGAVSLVSPSFRMTEELVETLYLPGLKDACETISAKLGYLKQHREQIFLCR